MTKNSMVIIDSVMVGNTSLESNKTLQHNNKTGIDVICQECYKPFAESLQESGIVNDCVVCSVCKKSLAFVVEA